MNCVHLHKSAHSRHFIIDIDWVIWNRPNRQNLQTISELTGLSHSCKLSHQFVMTSICRASSQTFVTLIYVYTFSHWRRCLLCFIKYTRSLIYIYIYSCMAVLLIFPHSQCVADRLYHSVWKSNNSWFDRFVGRFVCMYICIHMYT